VKVLVACGAGFIGSHTASSRDGHEVRVLDLQTGRRENLMELVCQLEFLEGDLRRCNGFRDREASGPD
jgi:nucleoside-diphosphate-sugar epimerase